MDHWCSKCYRSHGRSTHTMHTHSNTAAEMFNKSQQTNHRYKNLWTWDKPWCFNPIFSSWCRSVTDYRRAEWTWIRTATNTIGHYILKREETCLWNVDGGLRKPHGLLLARLILHICIKKWITWITSRYRVLLKLHLNVMIIVHVYLSTYRGNCIQTYQDTSKRGSLALVREVCGHFVQTVPQKM